MKLISLITRLSSLVTIVYGHARFARQAGTDDNDGDNNNPTCSDISDQCSTWKEMNLCTAEAVKKSCALTCDNCENTAAQIQNSNLSENDAANNNNNSSSVDDGDDVCEDIIAGCSNFSSQCDKINIRNGCRKTCNLCKIDTGIGSIVANQLCQDLLPACDLLSARTGCSSPVMKASCALTCGTCENILEPILNKKSNNEQPEIVSTTAITEVEEQATSVENTSETVKAESESENNNSDVSENSEETAEITKISDDEDLTSDEIDAIETGSSDNETIEIDDDLVTPGDDANSENSSVGITVVTTESSVDDEAEEKHDDDGKDHSGHSHNNNKSSGTETICWSVLVVVLTFLVL